VLIKSKDSASKHAAGQSFHIRNIMLPHIQAGNLV